MVSSSHEGNLLGEGMMFECGCFFQRLIVNCLVISFIMQHKHFSSSLNEWRSRQAQLNEAGNFLIEMSDASTSQSLTEELCKLNMQWADFIKRTKFVSFLKMEHCSFLQGPKLTLPNAKLQVRVVFVEEIKQFLVTLKETAPFTINLNYNRVIQTTSNISHNFNFWQTFSVEIVLSVYLGCLL